MRDTEFREQRRNREERAKEGVALHAKLQIGAVGGLAGDLKAGQREHADFFVDDLLARPDGKLLPGYFAFLLRFPDEASAFTDTVERIGVRKSLGIAAQYDTDVGQIAIHSDSFWRRHHKVGSWGALLLRTVFWVGANVDDFLGVAQFVNNFVPLVEQIVEVTEDSSQVLAGSNRTPSANRMEAHRQSPLRQK